MGFVVQAMLSSGLGIVYLQGPVLGEGLGLTSPVALTNFIFP